MPLLDRSVTATPAWRDRAGFCGISALDQPSGVLDRAQRADLIGLARQLRTAHDLIGVFADRHGAFPGGLVTAYLRELSMVRVLLDRYGLIDPDAGHDPGRFADATAQRRYDGLLRQGRAGRSAALDVTAALITETATLVDASLSHLEAPDVHFACLQLYAATIRQRRLVGAWSSR